jgi:hypothetical protein
MNSSSWSSSVSPPNTTLDSVFDLDEEGWRKLTFRWGLFFFVLAALNEIVWVGLALVSQQQRRLGQREQDRQRHDAEDLERDPEIGGLGNHRSGRRIPLR